MARQYLINGVLVNETNTTRQYIVNGTLVNEISTISTDIDAVATPETFSGGYPTRSKKKKTGYELAMEGLARMEYVKPQMRDMSVIEPTNIDESLLLASDSDEDDINAIMLLIH